MKVSYFDYLTKEILEYDDLKGFITDKKIEYSENGSTNIFDIYDDHIRLVRCSDHKLTIDFCLDKMGKCIIESENGNLEFDVWTTKLIIDKEYLYLEYYLKEGKRIVAHKLIEIN